MGALRTKVLAAFLAGILCVLGVQFVRDFAAEVHFRLDRIEQYLTQQAIRQQMGGEPQSAPQPRKESHRGEISKPQHWKV